MTPAELEAVRVVARDNDLTIAAAIREAVNSFAADYGERQVLSTARASRVSSAENPPIV